MIKHGILCRFAVWLCIFCLLPFAALGTQAEDNLCVGPDAGSQLAGSEKVADTAKAVIVYDLSTDTMLYTWNPDGHISPSNMVKLMLCLIAVEEGDLSDTVTVTRNVIGQRPVGTVVLSPELKRDEEVSVQDLLYGVMLASANDAALVLANYLCESTEAFVEHMNARADALGLTDTHYVNITGLDAEGSYTSARDILRLLDYALENETFRELFSAKNHTIPATNLAPERKVYTTNYAMSKEQVKKYYDSRVTGGKTGYTDKAGRCLAATAQGNGMELLVIVMGAEAVYEADGLSLKSYGSFEETTKLLDYTLERFERRQLLQPGQTATQFPVEKGTNHVAAVAVQTVSTVLPKDATEENMHWVITQLQMPLTAPVALGQEIAQAELWCDGKCMAITPLFAGNAVPLQQTPESPSDPVPGGNSDTGSSGAKTVIVIVAAVLGVGVITLILLLARRRRMSAGKFRPRRRRRS